MFSLIIATISVALIGSMSLATLYYGGTALNKGTTSIDVATIINQGQQINAAIIFSGIDRVEGVASFDNLITENYLTEAPTFNGGAWSEPDSSGYSTLPAVSTDVCLELNTKIGVDSANITTVTDMSGVFGCVSDGGANIPFYQVGNYYTAL